jgi:hypothetical protein
MLYVSYDTKCRVFRYMYKQKVQMLMVIPKLSYIALAMWLIAEYHLICWYWTITNVKFTPLFRTHSLSKIKLVGVFSTVKKILITSCYFFK